MPPKDADLTPMYRQWAQAKRDFPDVLLLFRMGDFYEMFAEDAEVGARAMGLTLTSRKYAGDKRIPMCGVPHHALDRYLRMLVEQGFRAAICEQMEDPRQAKGLVKRQVTRVVTPGTLTEDELLPPDDHNFLVSVCTLEGPGTTRPAVTGIAAVDVSTGDFLVTEVAVGAPASSRHGDPPPALRADPSPQGRGEALPPSPSGNDETISPFSSSGDDVFSPSPRRPEGSQGRGPGGGPPLPVDPPTDNPFAAALDEIKRLAPAEIIITAGDPLRDALGALDGVALTTLAEEPPALLSDAEQLCRHFGVDSLLGFGLDTQRAAIAAAAQALRYLQAAHLQALPQLTGLSFYSTSQFMLIDATTRRNLELTESLRGGKQATLVHLLDKTKSPMGARLLKDWIVQPLLDRRLIERRLDAVANLVADGVLADALREHLRSIYDLERLTSRTTAGTANARDLRALSLSLQRLPEVRRELAGAEAELLQELWGGMEGPNTEGPNAEGPNAQPYRASGPTGDPTAGRMADDTTVAHAAPPGALDALSDLLARALADDPPVTITEGGLIREGFSADLDELRHAAAHGREWIAELQDRERARTGIKNLKIGFNQVFGYYLEVTKSFLQFVPDDYQRKQTLANAERFITPELKEWENKVLGADERSRDLEYELFVQVRAEAATHAESLLATARALAQVDVLCALAQAAVEYGYHRPEITDSDELHIVAGRHPVVEQSLEGPNAQPYRASGPSPSPTGRIGDGTAVAYAAPPGPGGFVPNDAHLDCHANQLLILTGPNMAGKSTYLRQVALITLMAQMGSFVPAKEARVGLVDRIFTRVGASDDLATGQSTFMVEMTETANILHNATDRSLIILDEIGRGTSTFDGLSIAWAVAEYIIKQVGAKTLFATHYHHLNELVEILPRVRNLRVLVKEEGDHITFLRKIAEGGTDRSYGIQVARLAGLPQEVIERAKEVLRTIEQEDLAVAPSMTAAKQVAPAVQLHLFEAAPHPVVEKLKAVDVDTLTPVEALLLLKELQEGL